MSNDKIYSFDVSQDPPRAIEMDKSHILYGDSVTGDTLVPVFHPNHGNETFEKIADLFKRVDEQIGKKEYFYPFRFITYGVKNNNGILEYSHEFVEYIVRHRVEKDLYKVSVGGFSVTVTEDHSLMALLEKRLIEIKPTDLLEPMNGEILLVIDDGTNGPCFYPIHYAHVEKCGKSECYVYDMEVRNVHNFFGNNILLHNTDSIGIDATSVFDEDAEVDDVVGFGDLVAEQINERFPHFLQSVFNVQPENAHYLTTERETVFSKALFKAKKKYFQIIVDDEGKRVDNKEKIMGLEIKKTSVSTVTREYLYNICKMILDTNDRQKVMDYIEELKQDFRQRPIEDIATPTSVKTLYSYSEFDDNVPWHVKAAINYNKLCGPNDIEIKAGDKVKVLYVDGEQITSIAFPVDIDTIPQFVYDLDVNWRKEWKKVEKYINNYLETVGWDTKTYRGTFVEDLFQIQ